MTCTMTDAPLDYSRAQSPPEIRPKFFSASPASVIVAASPQPAIPRSAVSVIRNTSGSPGLFSDVRARTKTESHEPSSHQLIKEMKLPPVYASLEENNEGVPKKTKRRSSKAYTPEQKITYVENFRHEQASRGYMLSQRQFSLMNQLSHARFSAWCKDYDRLKSLDPSKLKTTRLRKSAARYPALEARVLAWVDDCRARGCDPSTKFIQSQARTFADEMQIPDFVASTTWIGRFKKRTHGRSPPESPTPDWTEGRSFSVIKSPSPSDQPSSPVAPERSPLPAATARRWTAEMEDQILQNFLRRSNEVVTQLEMAGMGLSQLNMFSPGDYRCTQRTALESSRRFCPIIPEDLDVGRADEPRDEDSAQRERSPFPALPFPKRSRRFHEYCASNDGELVAEA